MSRVRGKRPVWMPPFGVPEFPDPREFAREGLVAGGGRLSTDWLRAAYRAGIFPWYQEPPILWWSPDPRAILDPAHLHVSRSLARRLRTTSFTIRAVRSIEEVMRAAGDRREGTWVTEEMIEAYEELAREGDALAYEVREGDELVGGLYGVLVGSLFAAESKFHRRTDASKLALVAAVTHLFEAGVTLFDVQFQTPHLASLGVYEVPRTEYVARALVASATPLGTLVPATGVDLVPWLRARFSRQSGENGEDHHP